MPKQSPAIEDASRTNLMRLAKAYAKAHKLAVSTVSGRFYGQKSFLERFAAGKCTITVTKLDAMFKEFERNWPEGLPWPEMVPLPIPTGSQNIGENPPRA